MDMRIYGYADGTILARVQILLIAKSAPFARPSNLHFASNSGTELAKARYLLLAKSAPESEFCSINSAYCSRIVRVLYALSHRM